MKQLAYGCIASKLLSQDLNMGPQSLEFPRLFGPPSLKDPIISWKRKIEVCFLRNSENLIPL